MDENTGEGRGVTWGYFTNFEEKQGGERIRGGGTYVLHTQKARLVGFSGSTKYWT